MKTNKMKELFFARLESTGWKKDRFGHYHKELEFTRKGTEEKVLRPCRVKVQATSVRVEVKCGKEWFRRTGDYYSRMVFLEDERIRVGTMFFPKNLEQDTKG
jgi:hypothetical protein